MTDKKDLHRTIILPNPDSKVCTRTFYNNLAWNDVYLLYKDSFKLKKYKNYWLWREHLDLMLRILVS